MTQAELLRAYKQNGWIITKRNYSGCYICTLGTNVYRVETQDNREEEGDMWVVTTVSGECHVEEDCYVGHFISLRDAQIDLVNIQP